MIKKERLAYTLGVLLLGSIFGTTLFYNFSEFWDPAPVWSIPLSLLGSLLTCIPVLILYRYRSAKAVLLNLVLLIVIGVVITFVEDDSARSGLMPRGLLPNIQLSNSWEFRSYVLMPAALSVLANGVCGLFFLSLLRLYSNYKNRAAFSLNTGFFLSVVGVAFLSAFSFYCFTFIKSGPVYLTVSFDPTAPASLRVPTLHDLKQGRLNYFEVIASSDLYVANSASDDKYFQSILENVVLVKVVPIERWRRGKFRRALLRQLKKLETLYIGLDVYVNPIQPEVPLNPTYTFKEIEFVPDQAVLLQLGIDEESLNKILIDKFSSSYEQGIQAISTVTVNGQRININKLGSFKPIQIDYDVPDKSTVNWIPLQI